MKKGLICVLLPCVAVVCFCQTLKASPSLSDANEPKFDLKHPTDWLELGGDFRFRYIYDNNRKLDNKALGHDRSQLRLRARVQAKIKLTDDLDFNIRLMTEPRYYIEAAAELHKWSYNEALFDKFNLTWRNAFDLPLTIVAGRQDIILGSGWLVCDGTPLDGSRTGYFDALRFTYNFDPNITADIILIDNHADTAKWLHPFNDRDIDISEQDEQGAIIYLAQKTGKDSGRDLYFIYKHDTHRVISSGSEGEIYTIGTRFYGRLNDRWQYSMEFAPQFGHKNGKDLGAFGTNDQLIYNFNDEKESKLTFGYEYLSGNKDPDKYFDKGWGRLDTWSSLYQGNIDTIDGRAYESSNLHRPYLEFSRKLTEKTELLCGYHLLFADDNLNKTGGTTGLSKSGHFRGQLAKLMLKYKVSKNLEHRFEGEFFFPGNYYNDDKNDTAVFFRYTLVFTW
ncbi:MAG: alginate export family protein [Sedimentisphaerales bacterium]